jgi:hypothetical protein
MELVSGHEKIITKSRISPNAGTLNRGFTVDVLLSELSGVISNSKREQFCSTHTCVGVCIH